MLEIYYKNIVLILICVGIFSFKHKKTYILMPDYNNSKIYKIVSPSNPDLVYYGSTTQKLCVRMAGHRCKPLKTSGLITCYDDAIILLVENFSCNSKEELLKKEGEYILNNKCVNKYVSGRTSKQYREDNKEIIKNRKKIQYEENKELILDKQKEYYLKNIEKRTDYNKQYKELNKELNKQKQKEYREANKEVINKKRMDLYYKNKSIK
jgi:hypothetical protein